MNEKQTDALLKALSSIKSALSYIGFILMLSFVMAQCHVDSIKDGLDAISTAIQHTDAPDCNCSCP